MAKNSEKGIEATKELVDGRAMRQPRSTFGHWWHPHPVEPSESGL